MFGKRSMDVHNGHLNTAVSGGIPALLALYFQFGAIVLWALRLRARSKNWVTTALAEGICCAVLVIMIVNLFGTRLYDRQLVGFFWMLLGCLHGAATRPETPQDRADDERSDLSRHNLVRSP